MTIPLPNLPPLLFDAPWLLLLVILLPGVIRWLRYQRRTQQSQRLARYASLTALARLMVSQDAEAARRTLRLMAVGALIGMALAGPRWGLARGPMSARGIDMAIAIDASLSMLAQDERPSRLERVKQEVRRLRAMAPADRVALIAFAGRSYILTPLTADDGALELFLDNLDPSVVGQAGSALSRTIRQGGELLMASDGDADRALVVLSDGESFDTEAEIETAAAEVGANGISLITVGFGTRDGATIPVRDGASVQEKRDDAGQIVVTRYSPDLLQKAANAANGTFIPAEASDKAARIRSALRSLRTTRRSIETREDHVPRFQWFLVPALVLLAWDSWRLVRRPGSRRRHPRVPDAVVGAAASLIIIPGVLGSCAKAPDPAALFAEGNVAAALRGYREMVADRDTTAETAYNLGTTLIAADSLAEASERLEAVRRRADGETRFRARFNAGLAALLLGRSGEGSDAEQRLADARAAYRALLADRPGSADAKWNYELALRPPQPPSGGGGGGGGGGNDQRDPPPPSPPGGLDQKQAEALLNSAAREEREVQGRKQRQSRVPPGGKDW